MVYWFEQLGILFLVNFKSNTVSLITLLIINVNLKP